MPAQSKGQNVKRMIGLFGAALLIGLQACAQAPKSTASKSALLGEPVGLLIQGYNYTDDYISSFTVNGQGGGNLFVSSPTAGGGKSVCCVSYTLGTLLPMKVKVKWVTDYCLRQRDNPYPYGQRTYVDKVPIWREAEALVDDRSDGHPYALEIHIYPDHHVEGSVTRGHSLPRMILPSTDSLDRPGLNKIYPKCSDVLHQN